MSSAMKSYIAYSRLVQKAERNGEDSGHYHKKAMWWRDKAYAQKAAQGGQESDRELFERERKELGFEAAVEAAKARNARKEAQS